MVPKLRRTSGSRKTHYSIDDESWLVVTWKAMGKICSERIKAALTDWLPSLRIKFGLPAGVAEKFLQMSPSTMDRLLRKYRAKDLRKRNTATVPSLLTEVALKPFGLRIDGPGVIEIDTVAHCGGSLSGTFAWTVTATDIFSGFTICIAVWGKSAAAVKEALLEIEKGFPFPVHTFWFENGTEFINEEVLNWPCSPSQPFLSKPQISFRL